LSIWAWPGVALVDLEVLEVDVGVLRVTAASVSIASDGANAMTLPRSTKPGRLTPCSASFWLWTRTPPMAMRPIFFLGMEPPQGRMALEEE